MPGLGLSVSHDENLRTRLRVGTREEHEALDAKLSELDLRSPDGLSRFLQLQAAALPCIRISEGVARSADLADDLLACLRLDLAVLGVDELPGGPVVEVHALAMDYVVLGSRLGTAVLRRHWADAADPLVQRANRYFDTPARPDLWRAFCVETAEMAGEGDFADRMVRDVRALFTLYDDCAGMALKAGRPIDEFT